MSFPPETTLREAVIPNLVLSKVHGLSKNEDKEVNKLSLLYKMVVERMPVFELAVQHNPLEDI